MPTTAVNGGVSLRRQVPGEGPASLLVSGLGLSPLARAASVPTRPDELPHGGHGMPVEDAPAATTARLR
jgi:hypothetical protein